jgi:hypothetical protein
MKKIFKNRVKPDETLGVEEKKDSKLLKKTIPFVILILIFLFFLWGIFISRTGKLVNVTPDNTNGVTFVNTQKVLIEKLLNDTGGFLPNDIFIGKFFDNKRNFQLGVLETVRYSLKGLRDSLSRQRSTDKLYPELNRAFAEISANEDSLINPIPETTYSNAIKYLDEYVKHLKKGDESFYPRSDNLAYLIRDYASLLGGISSRLNNAVNKNLYVKDMKTDNETEFIKVDKVGFFQQDDVFYYALGVAYAMHATFKAIKIDFEKKLKEKEAEIIMDQIITLLESSYFKPWLWVMNSSKSSLFANHLANMTASLSMVRQKMNSLKIIVENN